MKIKKNNAKKWRILIVVILIVLICVIAFFAWKAADNDSDTDNQIANDTQQTIDHPKQPGNASQPSNNSADGGKNTTVPDNNVSNTVFKPTITYAAETNGAISIAAQLDGDNIAGVCRLTLQKAGEVDIVRDSNINYTVHYTCSIDNVSVPSSGGWTAKITNVVGSNESEPAILEVPY